MADNLTCRQCGRSFSGDLRRRYCSDACFRAARVRRHQDRLATDPDYAARHRANQVRLHREWSQDPAFREHLRKLAAKRRKRLTAAERDALREYNRVKQAERRKRLKGQ